MATKSAIKISLNDRLKHNPLLVVFYRNRWEVSGLDKFILRNYPVFMANLELWRFKLDIVTDLVPDLCWTMDRNVVFYCNGTQSNSRSCKWFAFALLPMLKISINAYNAAIGYPDFVGIRYDNT